jgi:tetratricopeptide (TPR) repeat protein
MGNQVNFPKAPYMTPYRAAFHPSFFKIQIFVLFLLALAGTLCPAKDAVTPATFDVLTQSGFGHYYSLEYDQATRDFQKAVEIKPDDPRAMNHLLEAVLFRELYKYDALDTSLYTQEGFLSSKRIDLESAVRQQIKDLADKALSLSDKRLKSNPQDVEALYDRGVTRGLRSTYLGLIEHAWFTALRNALGSRSDHEAVLALKPDYVDAKTIVGIHNYIVAMLPMRTKVLASIIGVTGDKKKGLDYLSQAANAKRESSEDARVALALFLRREQRYADALNVVQSLVQDHPHNFLFALEQANLLKDAGKAEPSISAYRSLLKACKENKYPAAHVELAQYEFGEALRGQSQYSEALENYRAAANGNTINRELRQRAFIGAGQVSDLLNNREQAVKDYQAAIALDSSSSSAEIARKYLSKPYKR